MITLYGIKNCDTVKKALTWAREEGLEHSFHDFRADGLSAEKLAAMQAALGTDKLLNTRGTTWRKLPEEDRADMTDAKAAALMLEHVALIKRPVWEKDGDYRIGFAKTDMGVLEAWVKG